MAASPSIARLKSSSTRLPPVLAWWPEPVKISLREFGIAPGLEHAVRVLRVVAEDGLGVGPVGHRRPELHEGHVVAVDVVPAGVEDPAVVVDARRPLEHLEGRDRPQVAAPRRPSRGSV